MIQTVSYQSPPMSSLPTTTSTSIFSEAAEAYRAMDSHRPKSESPPFSSHSPGVGVGGGPGSRASPEAQMEVASSTLVINLTPGQANTLPEHHHHHHHHGHKTAGVPAAAGEFQSKPLVPLQTGANVPFHLQPASTITTPSPTPNPTPTTTPTHASCSDSETASSQDAGLATSSTSTADMVTGTFRFSLPKNGLMSVTQPRAKREFVPDNKKDESYWTKRHKNNASARMSRYKRKAMQSLLEQSVVSLQKENHSLKCELKKLKEMFADQLPEDFGSPASSPSSGLTASTSSLSSGGSADRSSSSSPNLSADNGKGSLSSFSQHSSDRPVSNSDEEVEQGREGRARLDQHHHQQQGPFSLQQSGVVESASVCCPPPAHSKKTTTTAYSSSSGVGFPPALSGYRPPSEVTPPVAHSSYGGAFPSYTAPGSAFPAAAAAAVQYPAMQSWCNNVNADWSMLRSSASSAAAAAAAASFPPQQQHQQTTMNTTLYSQSHPHNYSSSLSSHSPGPSSSPSGMTISEDDSNFSADLRKSSSSDQDEDSQHKMRRVPLKCRIKANIKDVTYL